ncbi:MAG: DUF6054 family protein [Erysipelotrichaceae bacterium]
MFDKGLKMIREGYSDCVEISSLIKSKLNADLVYENWRYINDVRIICLCFEKYYFRNNSYAGLSLLITESNLIQTIDVVGFGGGGGPFNLSWGANEDFLQNVINLLDEKGFKFDL